MRCTALQLSLVTLLSTAPASADLVVPTERVTTRAIVREAPTSDSADIGSLRPGESLPWIQNVPRWREVRLSPTQTGFVTKSYTRVVDEETADWGADDLRIHFLNTGTGGCTVLECPGEGAPPMIIDCGSVGRSEDTDLTAEEAQAAVAEILANHPGTMPNLVLSHPDRDHYNLLPTVLADVQVNEIWQGGDPDGYDQGDFPEWFDEQIENEADLHNNFADDFHNDQQPLEELPCGDASAFILTVNAPGDSNAQSLVLMVEFNDFSAIFSGDAQGRTEGQALENYDNAVNTVLHTGSHHGADTKGSNGTQTVSEDWAEMTDPEILIYPSGIGFGHPRCEVTDAYDVETTETVNHPFHCGEGNVDVDDFRVEDTTEAKYATEINGTIVVTTDGESPALVECGLAPECEALVPF